MTGNRNDFDASDFHGRCDGRPNTLTHIEDTDRNVFGGFTPVEWHPRECHFFLADECLKSCLFTLTNPHNVLAQRFGLRAESKGKKVWCHECYGLCEALFCCIDVHLSTSFDDISTNDTGLDGQEFFTGS
jgi:hypothetical protein